MFPVNNNRTFKRDEKELLQDEYIDVNYLISNK